MKNANFLGFILVLLPFSANAQEITRTTLPACDSVDIPIVVLTAPAFCMEGPRWTECPMRTSYYLECFRYFECPNGTTGVYSQTDINFHSENEVNGFCSSYMGWPVDSICQVLRGIDSSDYVELPESDERCSPAETPSASPEPTESSTPVESPSMPSSLSPSESFSPQSTPYQSSSVAASPTPAATGYGRGGGLIAR